MAKTNLSPRQKRALVRVIVIDAVAITVGLLAFVRTGNVAWPIMAAVFGAGLIIPVILDIGRSQRGAQ